MATLSKSIETLPFWRVPNGVAASMQDENECFAWPHAATAASGKHLVLAALWGLETCRAQHP